MTCNDLKYHFTKNKSGAAPIIFSMIAIVAAVVSISLSNPHEAQAQATCFQQDPQSASQRGTSVPTSNASIEQSTYFTKQKGCLLNSLAQAAAKIALQQMTTQIVNWINSGFKGNPAFPTNPQAFFSNMTDQVAGVFLSQIGGPGGLCSPFSLDIRLGLALQASGQGNRYACTLSSTINNFMKGPNISINGKSIGSGGIGGFMGGDFSQGGWPAFIALTTQPQNNPYGAYLMAQSDLQSQMAKQQHSLTLDLTMGGGFMSSQKCTQLGTAYPADDQEGDQKFREDVAKYTANPGYSAHSNSDGSVTYENCTTETPGSTISSSLNKQLGSSVDSVVSIHDINSFVSQIAAALLTQVLSKGLYSSSAHSSSGNSSQSLVDQLAAQEQSNQLNGTRQTVLSSIAPYVSKANQFVDIRNQAVAVLSTEQNLMNSALACYSSIKKQTTVENEINKYLNGTIVPAINTYQQYANLASLKLNDFGTMESDLENATSIDTINTISSKLNALIAASSTPTTGLPTDADITAAQADLAKAQATALSYDNKATGYLNSCAALLSTP